LLFVMIRLVKFPSLVPLGNFLIKLDMFPMAKVPYKLLLSRYLKASNREKYVLVQGT
jgi:hypothetical protein